jgi:transketolase
VDRNRVSVDGATAEVMGLEPLRDKWAAFGWRVHELDGHDLEALLDCLTGLPEPGSSQPTLIVARTVAGKGVSFMEDKFEWHLGYLAPEDEARALTELEDDR